MRLPTRRDGVQNHDKVYCRHLPNQIWIILELLIYEVRSQYWELNLDYMEGGKCSPHQAMLSPQMNLL